MFSLLRNRFGIPGIISVIALVFAMIGGAWAANNSGGGKATASAKKGPRGPRGKPGKPGPTGPAGAQGLAGPQGLAGANGKDGSPGSPGTTGAKGATGATGPTGAKGATGATGPTGPTGPGGAPAGARGRSVHHHVPAATPGEEERAEGPRGAAQADVEDQQAAGQQQLSRSLTTCVGKLIHASHANPPSWDFPRYAASMIRPLGLDRVSIR